jgi:ribonucleoside-diphosphate reductase alpha chain
MIDYSKALQESEEYFNKDTLAAKVFLDKYALRNKDGKLLESSPRQMHHRLAKEFARIEAKKFKTPYTEDEIFDMFDGFKYIVPQGSPMFGIGNPYQYVSIANCFVIPGPLDSYLGIMRTDTQITQISCRRGGVGWNNSKLRPKNVSVTNAAKTTSGSVEFAKRFSNTVREVAQNGRRGASLQSLIVKHPDIFEFITVKQDLTTLTGSNISVQFTDEFMRAVEADEDFLLCWPVSEKDAKEMGRKMGEYHTIEKARKIWDEFVRSAWQMAEPGCMFIDRVHEESTSAPYGHIEESSNPCGEQFLPAYASCRLIVLNLLSFVTNAFKANAKFNFKLFIEYVKKVQRLADDLVDLEIECIDRILGKIAQDPEPDDIKFPAIDLWQNIRRVALEDRRTGCGFTALGDCIAALGMKYGSDESLEFAEKMQKTYKMAAYRSSIEMAKELGSFPAYDKDLDIKSKFIQRIKNEDPELFAEMEKYGRRNMTLLTVAPTGSVSCETQTSSGVEPVYELTYMRRKKGNPGDVGFKSDSVDKNGDHWMNFEVWHNGYLRWQKENPDKKPNESPYHESTAKDIDWLKRVKLQGLLQKHVDNSISSTVNLPSDATVELVDKIYMEAWRNGLKGITIYRDGCRDGVMVKKEETKEKITEAKAPSRPSELKCNVHHTTIKGHRYYVIVGLLGEDPYECFTGSNNDHDGEIIIPKNIDSGTLKKTSSKHYSLIVDENEYKLTNGHSDPNADALTRMVSCSLRFGVNMVFIIEQLEKTQGDLFVFAKVLARMLKKYIKDGTKTDQKCPDCGHEMVRESGCVICKNCGQSKCS